MSDASAQESDVEGESGDHADAERLENSPHLRTASQHPRTASRRPRCYRRYGLMALCVVLGFAAVEANAIKTMDTLKLPVSSFGHIALVAFLAFAAMLLGERVMRWLNAPDGEGASFRLGFAGGWKPWLALTAIILACWAPYVIYLYPGVMWYDTSNQLLQWNNLPNLFTSGQLTDHHPVLDTAVFGMFVDLGNRIGSGDLGIFLYSIVQSAVAAGVFAHSLQFMHGIHASHRMTMASLIFICLFPIFPMYSITMVKDSLFLPLMLAFFMQSISIVRTRGVALKSPLGLAAFLLCALAIALTKKTGLYVVVLTAIVLLFAAGARFRWRIALVALAVAATMMALLPKAVFPAAGIAPGGKQEMLAIPIQQSARVLRDHGASLDPQRRKALECVVPMSSAKRYVTTIADPVKGYVWDPHKDACLSGFMQAWLLEFFDHPGTYVAAFAGLEYGWLALPPLVSANEGGQSELRLLPVYAQGTDHAFFEGHDRIGLSYSGAEHGKNVEDAVNAIENIPGIRLVFSRAIWTTWMAAFICYECLRRRRADGWLRLAAVSPFLISFLLLWVSPTSETIEAMRYAAPQIMMVPLALAVVAAWEHEPAGNQAAGEDGKHDER